MHEPYQLTNVLPALMEAAGVSHPSQNLEDILVPRGRSLLPSARAEDVYPEGEALLWEHYGNAAVRLGRWKLARIFGQPWELYDLGADPTELTDVLDNHRDIGEALLAEWVGWADRVGVRDFERIIDLYQLRGRHAEDASG